MEPNYSGIMRLSNIGNGNIGYKISCRSSQKKRRKRERRLGKK